MTGPGDFRQAFNEPTILFCPDTREELWQDGELDRKYFKSLHWRLYRRRKLEAANYRCEVCGEEFLWGVYGLRPRVHHITYDSLGREVPEDCKAVCEDCHKAEHRRH